MRTDNLWLRIGRKVVKTTITFKWRWMLWALQFQVIGESHYSLLLGWFGSNEKSKTLDIAGSESILAIHKSEIDVEYCESVSIYGRDVAVSPERPNWHKDYQSGFVWPMEWYWMAGKIRPPGVDIKFPWELSRCQFLVSWACNYRQTYDEEVAAEFVSTIDDWLEQNPVGKGVNWACAMEVAIRAANWLVAMSAFDQSDTITDSFRVRFYRAIFHHGLHIESNLEGPGWYAANHYLADLAGLYIIGIFCPQFGRKAKLWRSKGRNGLEREIKRQVLDDGVGFERSTSYHRLGFELLFYPYLLGKKCGYKFSEQYIAVLKRMITATAVFTLPSGEYPQLGDNDSGQLFVVDAIDKQNLNYILEYGRREFSMRLPLRGAPVSRTPTVFLGPPLAPLQVNEVVTGPASHNLTIAGWNVLSNKRWWLLFVTGAEGYLTHAAHAHDDSMSFVMYIDGDPLIVDPGTYCYTPYPGERQSLRSAEAHNVLTFSDRSYLGRPSKSLFYESSPLAAELADRVNPHEELVLSATMCIKSGRWLREISVTDHSVNIFDKFDADGPVFGWLNLHPSVVVEEVCLSSGQLRLKTHSGHEVEVNFSGHQSLELMPEIYSPEYGVKQAAQKIEYTAGRKAVQVSMQAIS